MTGVKALQRATYMQLTAETKQTLASYADILWANLVTQTYDL